MGGDLFVAARITFSARLLIADVRGRGLAAISRAALPSGAFRAAFRPCCSCTPAAYRPTSAPSGCRGVCAIS
ncbi:hypothetical protein [Streptomyces sp. NPDC003710]